MMLHLDENLSMQLYAMQSYIRQQINVLHALISAHPRITNLVCIGRATLAAATLLYFIPRCYAVRVCALAQTIAGLKSWVKTETQ